MNTIRFCLIQILIFLKKTSHWPVRFSFTVTDLDFSLPLFLKRTAESFLHYEQTQFPLNLLSETKPRQSILSLKPEFSGCLYESLSSLTHLCVWSLILPNILPFLKCRNDYIPSMSTVKLLFLLLLTEVVSCLMIFVNHIARSIKSHLMNSKSRFPEIFIRTLKMN